MSDKSQSQGTKERPNRQGAKRHNPQRRILFIRRDRPKRKKGILGLLGMAGMVSLAMWFIATISSLIAMNIIGQQNAQLFSQIAVMLAR